MKIILSSALAAILGLGAAMSAFSADKLSYEDLYAQAQREIMIAQQMGRPSRYTTNLLADSKVAHEAGDQDKAKKLAKKALRRAKQDQHFASQERRHETLP